MKTAKVKAQELYPDESGFDGFTFDSRNEKSHFLERQVYIKGYDQAFQDFMEKAERWLEPTFKSIAGYNCGGDLINDFKNYMQNEM